MNSKVSFGIGCFHFGVGATLPFRFEGSQYIRELLAALQATPNLDSIRVDCGDEAFEDWSLDVTEELPSLREGPGLFPKPWHMDIEFEVQIPLRLQAQLLEEDISWVRTYTERFRVSIHYTYHLPVAFVELVDPSRRGSPSEAVIIVRRFLEQEFNKFASSYIRFELLGPSPFHADCYIGPGQGIGDQGAEWQVCAQRVPRRGYDEIVFHFNQAVFEDIGDARDAVFQAIMAELGFFYYLKQVSVVRSLAWYRLQELVRELISIYEMDGIRGCLKRTFACSKAISDVVTRLAVFEMRDIHAQDSRQKDYEDLYLQGQETYLQFYIENGMRQRRSYPTTQTRQLITFLEGRRAKSLDTLVVLASALLGGAVGALLTILLSA